MLARVRSRPPALSGIGVRIVFLAAGFFLMALGVRGLLAPAWQDGNSGLGAAISLVIGFYFCFAAARRLRRAWRVRVLTDRLRFGLCP